MPVSLKGLADKATPTMTKEVLQTSISQSGIKDATLENVTVKKLTHDEIDVVGFGNTVLDLNLGDIFRVTATGNMTISFANVPTKSCVIVLKCINFGNKTINFPANTSFAGGTKPQFTSMGVDILVILKDEFNHFIGVLSAKDVK